MLEKFAQQLEKTTSNEKSITENGAIGYKTTGSQLTDFNFKISSYRNCSKTEIKEDFAKVYFENPLLAMKMLFFVGDVRGGMGERRIFNACLEWLAEKYTDVANAVLDIIPEYNRWDSVINLAMKPETKMQAFKLIEKTLKEDISAMEAKVSVSLLAKWMPSINTSSKEAVKRAHTLKNLLGWDSKKYRKTLSALRNYSDVVEIKMSANNWDKIKYESVPSKANVIYSKAFMAHDENRRTKYLKDLAEGKTKINSKVAFPYDIVHHYNYVNREDATYEGMWKNLPDFIKGEGSNTICMVDGSYSMTSRIGNTSITCLEVAHSLGIYFAERISGAFKNQFITFSHNPKLVKFREGSSLYDKLQICKKHDECSNTDIYKAFKLILQVAIEGNLKQEEIPQNILVLSDMEFDSCSIHLDTNWRINKFSFDDACKSLFEIIAQEYAAAGYKLPKLVFWNICSRTNTIPLKENACGVALVSGFSPTIASMVFSTKLNPMEVLLEKLNSDRYDLVEKRVESLVH